MNKKLSVSFVVPVYAGENYLESLFDAQLKIKKKWENDVRCPLEILETIFVLDAPIDNSAIVLKKIAEDYSWVRLIYLSRNFGQHQATVAGILHSSGDWVVTMDEDLQHHPSFLPQLFEIIALKSSDVVYAKPNSAVHQKFFRDYSSKLYKFIMSKILNNPAIRQFNSYRVIRGAIARAAASVCSHETYYDIALSWFTGRIDSISLSLKDDRYIKTGKSGYDISKLINHGFQIVASSKAFPLRNITIGSFIVLLLTIGSSIFVAINKLIDPDSIAVQGWASLFLSILLLGGLTIFLVSLAIEYITSILLHSQGKPTFFIVDRESDIKLKQFFRSNNDYT